MSQIIEHTEASFQCPRWRDNIHRFFWHSEHAIWTLRGKTFDWPMGSELVLHTENGAVKKVHKNSHNQTVENWKVAKIKIHMQIATRSKNFPLLIILHCIDGQKSQVSCFFQSKLASGIEMHLLHGSMISNYLSLARTFSIHWQNFFPSSLIWIKGSCDWSI